MSVIDLATWGNLSMLVCHASIDHKCIECDSFRQERTKNFGAFIVHPVELQLQIYVVSSAAL